MHSKKAGMPQNPALRRSNATCSKSGSRTKSVKDFVTFNALPKKTQINEPMKITLIFGMPVIFLKTWRLKGPQHWTSQDLRSQILQELDLSL